MSSEAETYRLQVAGPVLTARKAPLSPQTTRPNRATRRASRAATAAAAATLLAAAAPASAAPLGPPAAPAVAAAKPDPRQITVKFKDGTDVSATGSSLRFGNAATQARIDQILGGATTDDVAPVIDVNASTLDARRARLKDAGKNTADLTSYVGVELDAAADPAAVLAQLKADPQVESAYVTPPPPIPAAFTEDLSINQTEQWVPASASPPGIGVTAASTIAGALGENVTVSVVEFGGNANHQEFVETPARVTRVDPYAPNVPLYTLEHGTKTAGVIGAKRDGIGVDGIAPKAKIKFYSVAVSTTPAAITRAAVASQPGDVIVLALQSGLMQPLETDAAEYDAIKAAVASGVHVVAAAGNGALDLDVPALAEWNAKPDSGAVIVGAGSPRTCGFALSKRPNSDFGARVNVQAPGDCVVTAGGGDLRWPDNFQIDNDDYGNYDSTSAASSATAGVMASLSSAYRQAMGVPLDPASARRALIATGSRQADGISPGRIGPQVNLSGAIAHALAAPDTRITSGPIANTLQPRFDFVSRSTTKVVGFDCRVVPVSGTAPGWAPCLGAASHQVPAALAPGEYRFEVRARKGPNGGVDPTPAAETFRIISSNGPGDVRIAGTTVVVTAAPGQSSELDVIQAGIGVIVQDSKPLQAGPGCTQIMPTAATCHNSTVTALDVRAGDGDDSVTVEASKPVTVRGGDGDDTVAMSGTTSATLIGDRGSDFLTSGPGGATFDGGDGDDVITGGTGPDTLDYSRRADAMSVFLSSGTASGDAARGTDTLEGSLETIVGGDGDDTLFDGAGVQTLRGGPGNDTLGVAGGGDDRADGGDGDDTFYDGAGSDQYFGEAGDDVFNLYTSLGADDLDGGTGADTASYASLTSVVNASADGVRNDGTPGSAQLDNILPDIEIIEGGKNNDTLRATSATLQLFGLGGDDMFISWVGRAGLYGGAGHDHVSFAGRPQSVSLGAQDEKMRPTFSRFTSAETGFYYEIEQLTGTPFDDTLTVAPPGGGKHDVPMTVDGGAGDDYVKGTSVGDVLTGGPGVDEIFGLAGGDVLRAKDGAAGDKLTCSAGTDQAQIDTGDVLVDGTACEQVS